MCYSMTNQVRSIAEAIKAIAKGDLTHRIQIDARGEMLELKATVNGMTEILSGFAGEVARVTRSIGTEGRLGVQARTNNLGGTWRYLTDSVNIMAANLTLQVRTIASAMTAVTRGDLTQKITGLAVSGEMLELVNTINDMLVQLVVFAREIKKVTREFGIEGMRLCVQAEVGNAQGIWQEIIQSLNMMASNLTTQLRDFTQVSVMGGDSSMFVTVEAGGESDSLKTQIDQMIVLRTNSQENSSAPTAL
ncbi:histidine kinase osmosensor [Pleurotus ostreatus]|nr:histidine kinase osmosensor [Pleurotus ostreatus]